MTYRFTIDLAPVGIQFEVGSIPEGLGVLVDEKAALQDIVAAGSDILNPVNSAAEGEGGEQTATKSRRGRKSNAEKAALAAAAAQQAQVQAPNPVPVPGAAPTPPTPPTPPTALIEPPKGDHGIPAELVRANQTNGINPPPFVPPASVPQTVTVAVNDTGTNPPAPPAPPPPAPPAAPALSTELADKIIGKLKALKDGSPDGGAAYAAWLTNPDPAQGYGIAKPGTPFDEVLTVLRFTGEPKLKQLATALGVQ